MKSSRSFDQCHSIVEMLPALRAFALTFYRDRTDADDLVQETLVRALGAFDTFEPGTRLKSWLFTIMRNAFYTKIKKYNRERPGMADCVSDVRTVAPTQERSIEMREVHEGIHRLRPHHREILLLIGVLEMSYEEAALITGCDMGTVKSRLNRARAALLADLGEVSVMSFLADAKRQSALYN
jgi:RNA polymerase sigma-70 factor (ECF subfamily)